MHLIAASTAGEQSVTFRLGLASGGTEEVSALVPAWDARTEGAAVAAYSPYVRTLSGDDASRQAYLYQLTLSPRDGAVSIELPQAPSVKIIAIVTETK
jgi:hypothetical protein